jgi:hypothetical protein
VQVKSEAILAQKEVNPLRQDADLAICGGHRCRDEVNLPWQDGNWTICEPRRANSADGATIWQAHLPRYEVTLPKHRVAVVNLRVHGLAWEVGVWIWRLGLVARDQPLMGHEVTLAFWHLILSCERIAWCFRRMSRCFFGEELGGLLARPFC